MTKLQWGLIGASDIAATRLIPAMRIRGDEIVAVQSGTSEWAMSFAARFGITVATTSVADLCDRSDIDAVYVSSTNDKHRDQVLVAAAAGKHILCEKPLALTVDDATTMIDAARTHGVVFAVDHHLPGSATHRMVQRLVREGAIGEPLAVRISHAVMLPERLRGWRLADVPGGGVVMDITCHDASAVNAILGTRPIEATALAVRQGDWGGAPGTAPSSAPDAVMATIRYEGDVVVQVHDAFSVAHTPTRLEVLGTLGNVAALGVMTQDPVGTIVLRTVAGEREVVVADRPDLYAVVLDAFSRATAGDGAPTVTGEDGLVALAVALAVQSSVATGRTTPVTTGAG